MRRTKALFALLAVLALVTAGEGWRLISRYGSQLGGRQAGGYLVLLGAVLLILTLLAWQRGEFAGDPDPAAGGGPAGGARRVAVCLAILAGYVFLTPRLGYLVATVLFFLTYLRVLGHYR
ncbi:MAG TPA: tripartite tricarboxylate transporter TctB family protein, partial [Gemmataceae bacterium]